MGLKKILLIVSGIVILAVPFFLSRYLHPDICSSNDDRTGNQERREKDATPSRTGDMANGLPVQASSLRIIAVGDVLLGRGVSSRIKRMNKSYASAFEEVADLLQKGDVVFANLEAPLTDGSRCLAPHTQGGKFIIKSPVESIEALRFAGFNLLNLAGNHMMDYYEEGLADTLDILDKNGMAHAGAGKDLNRARKAALIEKNGFAIGMLGYTDWADLLFKGDPAITFAAEAGKPGVAPMKRELIREDIRNLRGKVDVLIVSLHWGVEGSSRTTAGQVDLAHELIDSGADVILGHHPHRFQGIEIYKGKPILYSLGNFIFDQNDPLARQSFIIDIELEKNALKRISAVPVTIADKMRVVKTTGRKASEQMHRLLSLSRGLNTTGAILQDSLVFTMDGPSSGGDVSLAEAK